jgi:hypothetical protein
MTRQLSLIVAFAIVLFASLAPVDAKGESNSSVCEALSAPGVTPGLEGLCNAYCKKLDCPEASAGFAALSEQCKAPKRSVLEDYNKLKKPSDPPMPCVQLSCPCWTQAEVSAIGFLWVPHVVDLFPNVFEAYWQRSLVENRLATDEFPFGAFAVAEVFSFVDTGPECHYFLADFAPGQPEPTIRVQSITPEEADSCAAMIDAQVTSLTDAGVPVLCSGNDC